jgi:hypothetical protein
MRLDISIHIYDQILFGSSTYTKDATLPTVSTWLHWIIACLILSVFSDMENPQLNNLRSFSITAALHSIKLQSVQKELGHFIVNLTHEQSMLHISPFLNKTNIKRDIDSLAEDDVVSLHEFDDGDNEKIELIVNEWTESRKLQALNRIERRRKRIDISN